MTCNEFSLVGRLVADPEIKTSATGNLYARVRMAFDFGNKDRNTGEYTSDFFTLFAFGHTAERFQEHGAKGRLAHVRVTLQNEKWMNAEGTPRTRTVMICRVVRFLDKIVFAEDAEEPEVSHAETSVRPRDTNEEEEDDPFAEE